MKTVRAYQLIQEMRDLASSELQFIENYQEPHFNRSCIAPGYAEEAREVFNRRRLHNHRTIVSNAKDRIDALDLALRALHHFDVNT